MQAEHHGQAVMTPRKVYSTDQEIVDVQASENVTALLSSTGQIILFDQFAVKTVELGERRGKVWRRGGDIRQAQ